MKLLIGLAVGLLVLGVILIGPIIWFPSDVKGSIVITNQVEKKLSDATVYYSPSNNPQKPLESSNKNQSEKGVQPQYNHSIEQQPKDKASLQNFIAPCHSVSNQVRFLEYSRVSNDRAIVANRLVELNKQALEIGRPLQLHLFEDLTITAVFKDKSKATGISQNQIWRGEIVGEPLGTVTLVVTEGDVIIGSLQIPNRSLFIEIAYIAEKIHSIRKIDHTKHDPCGSCPTHKGRH